MMPEQIPHEFAEEIQKAVEKSEDEAMRKSMERAIDENHADESIPSDLIKAVEQAFPGAQAVLPGTPEYEKLVDITKANLEDESFKELENKILNWQVLPAPFSCSDTEKWQKWVDSNQDSYGRAAVVFAAEWAKNMDEMIAQTENKVFSDLTTKQISEASEKADDIAGGITGFMFGAAVQMLSECWSFGEDLRKYHNSKLGQPEAEVTLNPAVVTIGN